MIEEPKIDGRGFFAVWRRIKDWRYWPANLSRPFTEFEAWMDILADANYKSKYAGDVLIKRGQVLTSMRKLAMKWRWSEGKVRRWINSLIKGGEIDAQTTNKWTMITICNYDNWQNWRRTDKYAGDSTEDALMDEQTATTNKDNNINKGNKKNRADVVDKFVNLFQGCCTSLPRIKVVNESRKRKIAARFKEFSDWDWWKDYFLKIEASDFLTGRIKSRNPDQRSFKADIDWIINPTNLAKIVEGKYDNRIENISMAGEGEAAKKYKEAIENHPVELDPILKRNI